MRKSPILMSLIGLTVTLAGAASAGTLRCRSFNGNVTCSGSGAVSCQTVNGRTVCVGGHGEAIQSFGGGAPGQDNGYAPDDAMPDEGAGSGGTGEDAAPPSYGAPKLSIERHDQFGHMLSLQRQGGALHLRTGRLSIDVE